MKKFIAMKKFLGACLDKVILQQQNLEAQVGMQNLIQGVHDAVRTKDESDKDTVTQIETLMKQIDTSNKWISFQYSRTQTDPGFMRVPTPPSAEEIMAERLKKKAEAEQAANGDQPLEKVEETAEGEEDNE